MAKVIGIFVSTRNSREKYTVVFDRSRWDHRMLCRKNECLFIGEDPKKFSQFSECELIENAEQKTIGENLGISVEFNKLPEFLQRHIAKRIRQCLPPEPATPQKPATAPPVSEESEPDKSPEKA